MIQSKSKVALPKDLKRENWKRVLQTFQTSEKEELSVNEVAEITGISRATVTKAVVSFVQRDILLYKGKGESTDIGGKKPDKYAFNKEYQYLAYLNIGIGYLEMSILNLKFEVVSNQKQKISDDLPIAQVIEESKGCLERLLSQSRIVRDQVYGMSISTSGMIEQDTGRVKYNLFYRSWGRDLPIRDLFSKAYPDMVILVENIARAAGLAEPFFHKEFREKRILTIFTFLGISGCFIDQGKIENSKNNLIGEIGHMIVNPEADGVCRCGSRGCLEHMVSEESLVKKAYEDADKLHKSVLNGKEKLSLADVFDAANEEDVYAQELTEYVARYFAIAIRNIILTADPDTIVLQGIYANAGDYFEKRLMELLSDGSYFPDLTKWDFIFDTEDIWELARIGVSTALAERLYRDLNVEEETNTREQTGR